MDNVITHDFWKSQNDKWQIEKDKLKIQLDEIDKLDKEFYEKADILLGFTDNAYEYFSKGNIKQKRKILEIISEEITYKDKHFDIKLKPVFQTIAENQYNLTCGSGSVDEVKSSFPHQNFANNRTLGNCIIKGVETNSTPKVIKNSPGWTRTNNPSINSRMLRH